MVGLKVAGRYAQSLIELSEENGIVDSVLIDMKWIISTTNNNRDFYLFINSPLIKADKKSEVMDKLFGSFQELTLRFIHLLTRKHREMFLPIIAEEFVNKVNEMRGIYPMTLTSTVKLDEKVKNIIIDKLNQKTKGSIELTENIDASLIGGFVARMGDMRIDASISRQLYNMKQRLIR